MFRKKGAVNLGVLAGRAAGEPYIRTERDGSRRAFLKMYTDMPHPQYIDLQGYTDAETADAGHDPFEQIRKGDELRITYYVRTWRRPDNGKEGSRQDLQIIRMRRIRTEKDPADMP